MAFVKNGAVNTALSVQRERNTAFFFALGKMLQESNVLYKDNFLKS